MKFHGFFRENHELSNERFGIIRKFNNHHILYTVKLCQAWNLMMIVHLIILKMSDPHQELYSKDIFCEHIRLKHPRTIPERRLQAPELVFNRRSKFSESGSVSPMLNSDKSGGSKNGVTTHINRLNGSTIVYILILFSNLKWFPSEAEIEYFDICFCV